MGRRVRHLNPGNAGAVLALDSRFITGLSDGGLVSTWVDRSGSGNNANGSGTSRPTYETNEQAGCAVVRFDGSNDALGTAAPVTTVINNWSMFSVAYTRAGGRVHFSNGQNDGYSQTHSGEGLNGFGMLYGYVVWLTSATKEQNQWIIQTSVRTSGNLAVLKNGVQIITSASNPKTPTFATFLGTDTYGYQNCDIVTACIFPIPISNPLRRRLEHSSAFAFKIPCL